MMLERHMHDIHVSGAFSNTFFVVICKIQNISTDYMRYLHRESAYAAANGRRETSQRSQLFGHHGSRWSPLGLKSNTKISKQINARVIRVLLPMLMDLVRMPLKEEQKRGRNCRRVPPRQYAKTEMAMCEKLRLYLANPV
jgi:hypothetical protein